jgi:hypothetical protein
MKRVACSSAAACSSHRSTGSKSYQRLIGSKKQNQAKEEHGQTESGITSNTIAESTNDQIILADKPLTIIPDSIWEGPIQLSPDGNYFLANGCAVWNIKTGKKLQSDAPARFDSLLMDTG